MEIKYFPNCFQHLKQTCFLPDFPSQDLPLLLWVLLSWTALSLDFTEWRARASGQDLAPRASETRSEKCHRLDPRLLTKQAAAGGGKQKQLSKWYTIPEVLYSEVRKKGKSNQEMRFDMVANTIPTHHEKGKTPHLIYSSEVSSLFGCQKKSINNTFY